MNILEKNIAGNQTSLTNSLPSSGGSRPWAKWGMECFACPAGFSSSCDFFSFFIQSKGGRRRRAPGFPPLDPLLLLSRFRCDAHRHRDSLGRLEAKQPSDSSQCRELSWIVIIIIIINIIINASIKDQIKCMPGGGNDRCVFLTSRNSNEYA